MKPLLLMLGAALFGSVALYGKHQRKFWTFQAVMLPVFVYFFGADVMYGKGETTSSLWFLPFVIVWIVGTGVLGFRSLRHVFSEAPS